MENVKGKGTDEVGRVEVGHGENRKEEGRARNQGNISHLTLGRKKKRGYPFASIRNHLRKWGRRPRVKVLVREGVGRPS